MRIVHDSIMKTKYSHIEDTLSEVCCTDNRFKPTQINRKLVNKYRSIETNAYIFRTESAYDLELE